MSREEVATLAGGCFWCLEALFKEVKGVQRVISGYTGGKKEAIDITFFPDIISYKEILEIFFTVHDPTTLNRQGNDVGSQYRSAIFFHNESQKIIAELVIKEINEAHIWNSPVVTEIKPYTKFHSAEDYHRDYFERHPEQTYCQLVIAPKVAKFRKKWEGKMQIKNKKRTCRLGNHGGSNKVYYGLQAISSGNRFCLHCGVVSLVMRRYGLQL
jgi:peptide-methionine (S)-S-oxide reductase